MTYLDHAATTPLRAEVAAAMVETWGRVGNPSSVHAHGRAARRVLDESRERLAEALGARPGDVLLTSGGTESDNLAVKGLWWARHGADRRRVRVLVSAVEHHAVLDPARWLVSQGAVLVELPVDAEGRLDLGALDAELAAHADEVALVSVMGANNEIGTVQPIAEVVALGRAHGVPVHCDAVQVAGQLPLELDPERDSTPDAVTISAHKLGGPVGVGALVLRRGVDLVPVLHGGGQERGLRPGTTDVVGALGLATAAELAVAAQPVEALRLAGLRDDLLAGLRQLVPDAVLRGPDPATGDRLPANAHLTFPGCDADSLLFGLDSRGVSASTGSACTAGVAQVSHVLLACGVPEAEARGALRFSLGSTSTRADVEHLLAVLPEVVERARAASVAAGASGLGTISPRG